jgi:DNA repair exonuclease SbcCD nuclease subunit
MGMKVVHADQRSSDFRNIRFESAQNTVNAAKKHDVDFVLLAGDTFEDPGVDEVIVKQTVKVINEFAPIPVYVLPGNHDPANTGSVWQRQSWTGGIGAHVKLCDRAEPIPINSQTMLFPCPLKQKVSGLDPTRWIPSREKDDNLIRIGVAHGGLDILPSTPNFPISPNRVECADLDYLALGDWHGLIEHGRSVYSGTMEPTSFSEKNPGNVLIIDISATGEPPSIEPVRVARLRWEEFDLDLQDESDVRQFQVDLDKLPSIDTTVIRVNIGAGSVLTDSVASQLGGVRTSLGEEAFYLDWPEEPETTHFEDDERLTYPGFFQSVHDDIHALMNDEIPQGPGREFAGADPAVVRTTRSLLRKLYREIKA